MAQHEETPHIVKSYGDELIDLQRAIIQMGGLVERQLSDSIDSLKRRDIDIATRVIERDDEVDRMEEAIDKKAIMILATRQPVAIDLRVISMALKISNDLERIADYAANISKRALSLNKIPPLKPLATIPHMGQLTLAMIKQVLDAYIKKDADLAIAAWRQDDEIDALYDSLFRELATFMLEEPRNIPTCLDLLAVAKHLERSGDHACNIAEKIHYVVHGERINRMPAVATDAGTSS